MEVTISAVPWPPSTPWLMINTPRMPRKASPRLIAALKAEATESQQEAA